MATKVLAGAVNTMKTLNNYVLSHACSRCIRQMKNTSTVTSRILTGVRVQDFSTASIKSPSTVTEKVGDLPVLESVDDGEPDELYRRLLVEVKGHDQAVMKSYSKFVALTCQELDIKLVNIVNDRNIDRYTLLKSAHIFKKHRVQYEIRTHYKTFEFKHLTGSTASTFLEYIQRNLPEGMAMKVTKEQLEPLPEHMKTLQPNDESS